VRIIPTVRERFLRGLADGERFIGGLFRSNIGFWLVLMALTTFVIALRLAIALTSPVVGPDYGHYLIGANWYLGQDRSGEGPFDPPVVPLLIVVTSPLFGRIGALQVLGPVAAASVLPAAAYLMERFIPRWTAVLGATVFALWDGFTDFITFGGVTNLFGIAFSLVFLRVFFEALEDPRRGLRPTRRDILSAGLAFSVVSVHHLTAFVTGATVLLWVALRIALDREQRRPLAWTTVRVALLAVAMSAIYVPYLFDVTSNDVAAGFGRPFPALSIGNVLALTWRYNVVLWFAFLVLGLLACLRFDRKSHLAPFAVALLLAPILLVLTVLSSHPVRGLYFELFPIVFLAALWGTPGTPKLLPRNLGRVPLPAFRVACLALLLMSASLLATTAPDVQRAGMMITHDFMTQGTLEAFDWIRQNTALDAVVAVDGPIAPQFNELWKGMGLGWMLEGYANRRAIYEGHPVLLISQSKWPDVRDANRLFSGDTVFEDGLLRVADSFPYDDGASPMVYSAFLGDYHELGGFANPRLLDLEVSPPYPLILSANRTTQQETDGRTGLVSGTYLGSRFNGTRSAGYDVSRRIVHLELTVDVDAGSGWDGLELTIRLPMRTVFDLSDLTSGVVRFEVATFPGSPKERVVVQFFSSNLSTAQLTNVQDGIGIRWILTGTSVALRAELSFTSLLSQGCSVCPLLMRTSSEIIDERSIGFLFVPMDSSWNLRRFDREPDRYSRIFFGTDAIIYRIVQLGP
jgi:hypothetical protein